MRVIKSFFSNKVIFYITSRYLTYGLQFLNSILIAIYLGPYYLGIWGFITLVIQYFSQINFGVSHSVNTIISVHKKKEKYVQKVVGASLWMLLGLSFFIALLFALNKILGLELGNKYDFDKYSLIVCLIVIVGYFNNLFISVFRVFGRIKEVAFNQSAFPILTLIPLFVFKGSNLLWALISTNLLAFLLSFIYFLFKAPIKLSFFFNVNLFKAIQIKGWHLFLYNTSFFLIMISTRFLISGFYSVQEFGYFTFAFTLSNAMLLLLQSVSFLIFPKLLNRFASATNDVICSLLSYIRDAYCTVSHGLIHIAIFFFPYFMILLPQYKGASIAFNYIALTVVLYTNSFGYQGLLIAKGKEKMLGLISFCALIFNLIFSYVLIHFLHVAYYQVVLGNLLIYYLYVHLLGFIGRRLLGVDSSMRETLKDVFPLRLFFPYIASFMMLSLTSRNIILSGVPLILFIILNLKEIVVTKNIINNILTDPSVSDI